MKRKVKNGLIFFLLLFMPAVILTAQEKQNEQRIKIVVADKSGTKVEVDTLIKGGTMTDSIKLKNGEVIYLASRGKGARETHLEGDHKTMFVTYSTGEKGEKGGKGNHKTITVISGDSASVMEGGEGNEVVIIKDGKHITEGKGDKVVTFSTSGSGSKGSSYIYVNDDKDSGKKNEKTYDMRVTTDEKGNTVEKTKYVIAKNGIVVTIEGNDEAKVKEILDEVQTKLGIDQKDKLDKKDAKKEARKEYKDSNKN
jgi:hypothetical protein